MRRFCSLILCVILLCLSAQAWAADRDFWIQRYLSVSYPLKHVKVNSPFGTRRDPFTGAKASHNGLDLLQHGEYTISYCHLSKVRVSEGDELIAGDVVAVSGNTGRSTGSHLHITCRYKGALTDPYTLLLYIGDVRAEACTALLGEGVTADIDSISQYQRMDRAVQTWLARVITTLALSVVRSGWPRADPIVCTMTISQMRSSATMPPSRRASTIIPDC